MIPRPAHLAPVSCKRASANGRAYRLNEASMPTHDGSPESTLAIVSWLGVERHERWRPGAGSTFCNVYAFDLCTLLGAYLPRVWWLPNALRDIEIGRDVTPVYAATVGELSANALYRWLAKWSHLYGWRRVDTLDEAQEAANRGRAVVICGRNKVEANSGHIACVAPESDRLRARRDPLGRVVLPVESQAGGRNYELSLISAWWTSSTFAEFGFWIHDPTRVVDGIDPEATLPGTPKAISSTQFRAVREPIADLSLTSPATPLRAGEGEHTPSHLRDDEPPPDAA